MSESNEQRWQPLEANEDVMNKFTLKLGLSNSWKFNEVFTLECLEMIPAPCCAFILLFPITKQYLTYCAEEKAKKMQDPSPDVYFMKQTIGNACGTIALMHCIANNLHRPGFIEEKSTLDVFFNDTKDMSPEERGKRLENDESICKAHEVGAREGQSREISAEERVDMHFIGIVNVDGYIYELDGRKPFPVRHDKCEEPGKFVEKASKVCKEFMQRDPNEQRFSIVALSQDMNQY